MYEETEDSNCFFLFCFFVIYIYKISNNLSLTFVFTYTNAWDSATDFKPFFLFSINHHLKASTHKRVKPLLNTIHPQRWNKNNPARQAPRKLRKTLKLQTTVQTSLIHTTVPPAGTSGFWIFQKTRTQNLTGEQDQHNEWKHTCHDDNPEFFGISNHYKMPPFQSLNEERRTNGHIQRTCTRSKANGNDTNCTNQSHDINPCRFNTVTIFLQLISITEIATITTALQPNTKYLIRYPILITYNL